MLFVPAGANTFTSIQSDTSGRPSGTQGTAITPATANKGSWAQLIAATTHTTYGILICINSNTASSTSRNTVVDIGIGAAGSEIVVIADLLGGNAANYNSPGSGIWYYFPIALEAGVRVAARARSTVTTGFRVFVQLMQEPANPSLIKKASYVETLGVAGTAGTSVTPGTTAESEWILLGTTSRRCWFWQVGAQVRTEDTSHVGAAVHIDLAEGDGTNFNVILQDAVFTTASSESHTLSPLTIGCEYPVPEGRNIYVRAQSSNNAEVTHMAAYGAGG